jgi:hypothetical protein
MTASDKDLARILRYAKSHCEDKCPADRDPEVCLALVELCRALNVEPPACVGETNGLAKSYFVAKIKEIERRRGKPIKEVLKEFASAGIRNLEENIDKMEAEFALQAIKAIDQRAAEKDGQKKSPFRH